MDRHQSANLDYNLYRTCDPWHMDQDWKIECWEADFIYRNIWAAPLLFRRFEFSHCHQVAQLAFWASVAPVALEVHPCLCASSKSVDSLLWHLGKEDSRPIDFHEPLPGVFLSQPSLCYARESQQPASSLFGLRREVSWLVVVFPPLRSAKTLLEPFWPYSRQDAYRTVQVVPNLFVLP